MKGVARPECLTWMVACQVDVYSFGVVLWELWTGKEPYEGLNYHALLHQITLTGGTLRPTLPNSPKWEGEPIPEPAPGWCNLVERCWQEAPEQRPSFAEVSSFPSSPRPRSMLLQLCLSCSGLQQRFCRRMGCRATPLLYWPPAVFLPQAWSVVSHLSCMAICFGQLSVHHIDWCWTCQLCCRGWYVADHGRVISRHCRLVRASCQRRF